MLPAPFHVEGATLPHAINADFERFYRAHLRRVTGARIRSTSLRDAYLRWAAQENAVSLTFNQISRFMEIIGHRRMRSNGVQVLDLAYASDFPNLADNLQLAPQLTASDHSAGPLVERVDRALAALLDLRVALIAADERRTPHEAAQRVLGLFDQ